MRLSSYQWDNGEMGQPGMVPLILGSLEYSGVVYFLGVRFFEILGGGGGLSFRESLYLLEGAGNFWPLRYNIQN